MTKKHFISLADAIRPSALSEEIVTALRRWMKRDNPAFKEDRWRDYLAGNCGPNGGRIAARTEAASRSFLD